MGYRRAIRKYRGLGDDAIDFSTLLNPDAYHSNPATPSTEASGGSSVIADIGGALMGAFSAVSGAAGAVSGPKLPPKPTGMGTNTKILLGVGALGLLIFAIKK